MKWRDDDDHTWRAAVDDEPRCTLTAGTCYCTGRAGCLRANEDAYDTEDDD